ncbi:MAG TPA: LamG-like jellyroll fold domain-containing protein [Saprospiraceae bacterium]|nr:LamG-like jellyroll fold domain-containing protein [Saprospiraceae bacterium]
MKNRFLTLLTLGFVFSLGTLATQAQNNVIEYLPFENCDIGAALPSGNISCECGVLGESLFLDGQSELQFNNAFSTSYPSRAAFTLSFYIRPSPDNGEFVILSKRAQCSSDESLQITYSNPARIIAVSMSEDINNSVTIAETLPEGTCWHLITITKLNNTVELYINGEFAAQERSAGGTIDLGTSGPWRIGGGPCVGNLFKRFRGNIDEFYYFSRALSAQAIKDLYFQPDLINQRDTTIFIGDTLDLEVPNSCASNFFWSPSTNISTRLSSSTRVYPEETTTYSMDARHNSCEARDTVRIVVVDPDEVGCEDVFLANAFTPNGDGRNDIFKIDNPIITDEIESFEVFDRWGGKVFMTSDVREGWDGMINGEQALPGVYIYKVVYDCNGVEKLVNGSVTLIR